MSNETETTTIPAATVPLPSRGKLYPPGSPLHGKTTVDIKAMSAVEEDILTSKNLIKSGKVLDALMSSCILDKKIKVDELLVGDRNAILTSIRITGFGTEYTLKVKCPSCDRMDEFSFDLSQLPLRMLDVDPVVPGTNGFEFELPFSKRKVVFKLPTGNDEKEFSQLLENMEKAKKTTGSSIDQLVTTRLKMQVISIGGETDKAKLTKLIQEMPTRDTRALRKAIEETAPDVVMKQEFECSHCDEKAEVDVPMGTEFFWPSI